MIYPKREQKHIYNNKVNWVFKNRVRHIIIIYRLYNGIRGFLEVKKLSFFAVPGWRRSYKMGQFEPHTDDQIYHFEILDVKIQLLFLIILNFGV